MWEKLTTSNLSIIPMTWHVYVHVHVYIHVHVHVLYSKNTQFP